MRLGVNLHRRCLSYNEHHSVVCNARVQTPLGGHRAEVRTELALITGDNLRSTMRDYGSGHPLFLTPSELRSSSHVSDEFVASLTNERPHESRPIADVNLHIFQRCGAIVNE